MKSSPTFRVLMAAGMYLLLMWGYLVLQTPQLYAVFAALIMSIALLFWVNEARTSSEPAYPPNLSALTPANPLATDIEQARSLSASVMRLDALKAELTQQYAQFGKDLSLLNGKGLGTWHQGPRKRGGER